MKLLVTGGSGFIGSNFIVHILTRYPAYEVVNLDLLSQGNVNNLSEVGNIPNYKFVQGDICDAKLVDSLVKDCNVIVNFAAETNFDQSINDPSQFIRTNIFGTYVLLEAARKNGLKRFHQMSTDQVFGSLGLSGLFNERKILSPTNPYAATKAGADHLVISYHKTFNLPATISYASDVYGPKQSLDKFIAKSITNIFKKEKIIIYGDGMNIRDWLYVDDCCEAIDVMIHRGTLGEIYCVGGQTERNNVEVARQIIDQTQQLEIVSVDDAIDFVKDRAGHDRRYGSDIAKIKNQLGWQPVTPFEEGLRRTILWYQENEWAWKK